MRYQVLNLARPAFLGQECTGDVCRIIPKPTAPSGGTPSGRSLTAGQAAKLGPLVQAVIDSNPACFEGEDLSVAYSLAEKLSRYGPSGDGAFYRLAVMVDLSEDEARVLSQAEVCYQPGQAPAPIQTMQPSSQPTSPAAAAAPLPEAPASFPVVPVAVGAGALGLAALIISLAK